MNRSRDIVLFFSLPVIALLVLLALGFDGLYGQDSYEYLRYSQRIQLFILEGQHPGWFWWPKGYPIVAAILGFIIPLKFALQLVSFLSLYGTFYFSYRLIKLLFTRHKWAVPFLTLAWLLSPYVFRNSVIAMSDLLAVFSYTVAVYYTVRYSRDLKTSQLVLAAFFGTYTVFTRYGAVVPVVVLFLLLFCYWLKVRKLQSIVAILPPLLLLVVHFLLETNNLAFSEHEWLLNWNLKNAISSAFSIAGGNRFYTFPNFVYALFPLFHPGFFILNIVLVYLVVRYRLWKSFHRNVIYIGLLPAMVYAIFIMGIPFQNNRFLLQCYPVWLVFLFPAYDYLAEKFKSSFNWLIYLVLILQVIFAIRAFLPIYSRNQLEKQIVQELEEYQGMSLYVFDMDIAMKGRGLEFNYLNLWEKNYHQFDKGALALFSEEELANAWEGKTPVLNWNKLKKTNNLVLLKVLPNGWKLYRIE